MRMGPETVEGAGLCILRGERLATGVPAGNLAGADVGVHAGRASRGAPFDPDRRDRVVAGARRA